MYREPSHSVGNTAFERVQVFVRHFVSPAHLADGLFSLSLSQWGRGKENSSASNRDFLVL